MSDAKVQISETQSTFLSALMVVTIVSACINVFAIYNKSTEDTGLCNLNIQKIDTSKIQHYKEGDQILLLMVAEPKFQSTPSKAISIKRETNHEVPDFFNEMFRRAESEFNKKGEVK